MSIKNSFFEKLFINSELKRNICEDLNIEPEEYTKYYRQLNSERATEIAEIKRVRNLYNNKKNLKEFKFADFNSFYKWHKSQYQKQEGKCYYCKTEEKVIATLFEKKFQNSKRTKRGKHLEIERRDSITNLYNEDNCVLACYFCNNDKSDIFEENDYLEYLKDRKGFLTTQYEKLKNGNK